MLVIFKWIVLSDQILFFIMHHIYIMLIIPTLTIVLLIPLLFSIPYNDVWIVTYYRFLFVRMRPKQFLEFS